MCYKVFIPYLLSISRSDSNNKQSLPTELKSKYNTKKSINVLLDVQDTSTCIECCCFCVNDSCRFINIQISTAAHSLTSHTC